MGGWDAIGMRNSKAGCVCVCVCDRCEEVSMVVVVVMFNTIVRMRIMLRMWWVAWV